MQQSRFPVIWLTGNTGAGKTTLASAAQQYFNEQLTTDHPAARRIMVLDGDEMRSSISVGDGLSPEDRRKHNLRVARLAKLLQSHGFLVIVAVIAPFATVRSELAELCDPKWIYVKRDGLDAADRPYEVPSEPDFTVDNNELSIEEARREFFNYLETIAREANLAFDLTQKVIEKYKAV